ncbi:MAG: PrpF domain-containing protein, partial [Acetobacteraceae bacterium]
MRGCTRRYALGEVIMALGTIPAVFMRGGTSKAIMFDGRVLPADKARWDLLFTSAMGSPDPYGRQLDGMGGGISSLSKVCVITPSSRDDADVDYTFAQVQVREGSIDYRGNCGNMSSAVGPFAVDQGLVRAEGDTALVRIFNTNTAKLIHATFPLRDGRADYRGELAIPGVSGTGAPIRLEFVSPGGASTGKLLPTGNPTDRLDIPGLGPIEASMVDAANGCVFIRAGDIGLTGRELPEELETRPDILRRLAEIRVRASLAMGIAKTEKEAR